MVGSWYDMDIGSAQRISDMIPDPIDRDVYIADVNMGGALSVMTAGRTVIDFKRGLQQDFLRVNTSVRGLVPRRVGALDPHDFSGSRSYLYPFGSSDVGSTGWVRAKTPWQRHVLERPGDIDWDANLYRYVFNSPLNYTDPTGTTAARGSSGFPTYSSAAAEYGLLPSLAYSELAVRASAERQRIDSGSDPWAAYGPRPYQNMLTFFDENPHAWADLRNKYPSALQGFFGGSRSNPFATQADVDEYELIQRGRIEAYEENVAALTQPSARAQNISTRAGGVGQASLSLAGLIATAPLAFTPWAGVPASMLDNLQAGVRTAASGEYTRTGVSAGTAYALEKAGVSKDKAYVGGEIANILAPAGAYQAGNQLNNLNRALQPTLRSAVLNLSIEGANPSAALQYTRPGYVNSLKSIPEELIGAATPVKINAERTLALLPSNGGTGPLRWQVVSRAEKVHGNSLLATGPHDVYAMRDLASGRVLHIGETGRGAMTRGIEWQRSFQRLGIDTEIVSLRTVEGKAAAKALETRYIQTYNRIYGQRPQYNLTDH
jgi:hypothetical protein